MELYKYRDTENVREFFVEAIEIPIVYNRYGDHDPNGLMYVLAEDAERVRKNAWKQFRQKIPQPYEEVQPLVLRVHAGETVRIHFSHSLKRNLSMHVQGLEYDVLKSDGAAVGFNPDTTTSKKAEYVWYAKEEGVYLFSDLGDPRSSEDATNVHGLFGAVIVEAPEAVWRSPRSKKPIKSGLFADIYTPGKPAFREYTVFFHDELEILNKDGKQPVDLHTGLMSMTTGISYRSEPMRNRKPLTQDHADSGEDISMSSWVYQDPAPPLLHAYVGDPAKIRLVHGGVKETHVFHLHNHQWRLEGENPVSTIIDSISISPQECYTLSILHGAGSKNGMIGDAIFHCHLYPHFHEGMWTLWRVHDRLEDGSGKLPDGTNVPPLIPLCDRKRPPKKDALHPGYPWFVGGKYPKPPLQPPFGVLGRTGEVTREPTSLEEQNFVPDFEPGALYTDTCPCHTDHCEEKMCRKQEAEVTEEKNQKVVEKLEIEVAKGGKKDAGEETPVEDGQITQQSCEEPRNVKVFEIAMVQAKLKYNRFGWNDPQGRFFVLKEELLRHGGLDAYIQKVETGKIRVEPLVIRANAGDCIELRTTNLLPEYIEESPFQMRTKTDIVGHHLHLVKFDTIVSDGSANGWNNIAGARRYETLVERFFADTELRTVFFHDHLFANTHQQHGLFGALIIEEAGATFHHIRTGETLASGTQAVIRRRDGSSFREAALFVHDFALLFDKKGEALNPPEVPGSHDDPGVMGINYHSEPMRERLCKKADPAYVFSSHVHGDPATPLIETYPGEELVIRLLDGAHEEQHSFNLNGMSWKKEPSDPHSPDTQSQTIGISEAFNIHITEPYQAGDYLYYFGGIDDLWLGLWGIIRVYDHYKTCLRPLCKSSSKSEHAGIFPLPPCPGSSGMIRHYEIAAVQADLCYNCYGDHDPDGMVFVPYADLEKIRRGGYRYKPLILRANVGEWVEVTLHNCLTQEVPYFSYPKVPLDRPHTPSMRVSLQPQFLKYDPVRDAGVNVGYNSYEQTVGVGESRTYRWFADREYGTCTLQSFGDVRNHRYHGLFGALIVEPAGARWFENETKKPGDFSEQAVITAPGQETFREFVLFIQNGIRLLDRKGNLIQTATADEEAEEGESEEIAPVDAEDTGEKGYNYRSERFYNRFQHDSRPEKVFSSLVHGDPATPIFRAETGDRVIFRTLMPADKPRNVGFAVHGHIWKEQPKDPYSREIPLQGAISIGNRFDIELKNGASCPGDYLYRSGSLKWDVESGMWGIMRVAGKTPGSVCRYLYGKIRCCFCRKKM
ncbi:MAG: multicopper oxidase domain-containing protein [Lachnospiraceae bacterium]